MMFLMGNREKKISLLYLMQWDNWSRQQNIGPTRILGKPTEARKIRGIRII